MTLALNRTQETCPLPPIDAPVTFVQPHRQMPHAFDQMQLLSHEYGEVDDSKRVSDKDLLAPAEVIEKAFCKLEDEEGGKVGPVALKAFDQAYFGPAPAGEIHDRFEGTPMEYAWHMMRPGGALRANPSRYRSNHGPEGSSTLIITEHMGEFMMCGGRYGNRERPEEYGWDAWTKVLGLAAAGQWDVVRSQLVTKTCMIAKLGYDPNGNSVYYDREQPRVLAKMVNLLATHEGPQVLEEFLPYLLHEEAYWDRGKDAKGFVGKVGQKVHLPDGGMLDVYDTKSDGPRPEGYVEDLKTLAEARRRGYGDISRDIREACSTGWDFGVRTQENEHLWSMNATQIAFIEPQALGVYAKRTIARAYRYMASKAESLENRRMYLQEAAKRTTEADEHVRTIRRTMLDEQGICRDFNYVQGRHTDVISAAIGFMLDSNILTDREARRNISRLNQPDMHAPGGLMVTPITTPGSHNWGSPNVWPMTTMPAAMGAARHADVNWNILRHLDPHADSGAYFAVLGRAAASSAELRFGIDIMEEFAASQESVQQETGGMKEKLDGMHPGHEGGNAEYDTVNHFGPAIAVYVCAKELAYLPGRIKQLSDEAKEIERQNPGLLREVGLQAARGYFANAA